MATENTELTPAMRQYMQAKRDLPENTILFFRMGDFYELFFDDAKTAAPLMECVLTARAGVPMCGVPYHAARGYVAKIIAAGLKVAIAEQTEDPKLAKGLVKREILQIITPGTILDDNLLNSGRSNFLAALFPRRDTYGLAALDLSTGDFRTTEIIGKEELEREFQRLNPPECLIQTSLLDDWQKNGFPFTFPNGMAWSTVEDWFFDNQLGREELQRHFKVASLDGFGCRGLDCAVSAAGAILQYARNNLRQDASQVTTLQAYRTDDCLILDRISQRNLELVEPIFSDVKGNTLLSVLDETVTPMGARLMREWVLRPLRQVPAIQERQTAVADLLNSPLLLAELREILTSVRDLERILTRLNLGTNASARDLLVLKRGLQEIPGLQTVLAGAQAPLLQKQFSELQPMPELTELIDRAIVAEPPVGIKDGGMFKPGFNQDLDTFHNASTEGKDWIAAYQAKEIERTGIKTLKVRFNKVFGYFIEISKSFLDMIPPEYMRKQTIVNGERFITPELKEIEDKVLGAEEKGNALEYELFQQLRQAVIDQTAAIQQNARALGQIDCLASLADVAGKYHYIRPEICQEPVLEILDGRHPVLDARMTEENFVPNDVNLNTTDRQLALITGPNMAGKSTYIRQVALLVIMAQMGSFIPAKSARVGLADRIFTRVGAADDISRGQSTFMVEMVETANILNHATPNSLIILDEIGRGTSTFDGLSLAWAIAEFLHDNPKVKARTLFATHYHELTDLAITKNGVKNYNVLVKEQGENITFMRKIVPGAADKSYGIHVARLAGLPSEVLCRAAEVLANLESDEIEESKPKLARTKRKRNPDQPGQLLLFPDLFNNSQTERKTDNT